MKWGMFMLAEYGNMFAVSAIIVILFFGGYQSPIGYLGNSVGASMARSIRTRILVHGKRINISICTDVVTLDTSPFAG